MDSARRQAIIEGRGRYFTGRPCAYGHVAERGTVNGQCVECARLARQTDHGREQANAANRRHYRRKHPVVKKRSPWNAGRRTKIAAAAGPIVGVMAACENGDKVRSRARLGKPPQPIVGVMDVRERADAARSSGEIGTLTTARPKPIVGTMVATDFADNDAQPIKGKLRAVDPRDVAKFMRWRTSQRD